jgi:hypothetical protein
MAYTIEQSGGFGWLSPDGKLVPAPYYAHWDVAGELIAEQDPDFNGDHYRFLFERHYVHIGACVSARHQPTRAQRDMLMDLATRHGKVMDAMKSQDWKVRNDANGPDWMC